MHFPTKIKSQILVLTTTILCVTFILQISLHFFMQRESGKAVSSLLNSVLENTVTQIKDLNADIAEISFLLTAQEPIQSTIYKYTSPEIVRNISSVNSLLNEYQERNRNIAFLAVYKDATLFFSSKTENLDNYAYTLIEDFLNKGQPSEGFLPSFVYNGHTYFAYVTPIYPADISFYTGGTPDDYVVCIYRIDSVNFGAYNFIDGNQFHMIITDTNNHIQFSSDPNQNGTVFEVKKIKNTLHKITQIENPDWKIIIYHPGNQLPRALGWSPLYLVFMISITISMLAVLFLSLNKIFVNKILILKEKVKKIPTQGIAYRIQYSYNDELKEIATVFNQILDDLHVLNDEKLQSLNTMHKAQLMQKETQMLLLHEQVSPHFLYNSMSHIQGVAFDYDATEIVLMTTALSKVFRYYSGGRTQSTIMEDLNCAIDYFNVINLRRKNKIVLVNSVNEELMHIRCPKLIYQPVLENVLKHAYDITDSGNVVISSVPDQEKAIIEVADNGCGIPEETLKNINELLDISDIANIPEDYDHVGLVNVNLRLKLYYGDDCGIKISSSSAGTTVRIVLDKTSPETN